MSTPSPEIAERIRVLVTLGIGDRVAVRRPPKIACEHLQSEIDYNGGHYGGSYRFKCLTCGLDVIGREPLGFEQINKELFISKF